MNVEEVVANHRGWLIHVARSLRSNWEMVDDLAQEGAIEMWRSASRWDGRGNQLGWMKHAARLRMLQIAFPQADRRQAHDLMEFPVDPHSTVWGLTHSHDNYDLVAGYTPVINEALSVLSDREKQYVQMRFWEQRDTKHMKDVLGRGCHSYWTRAKLKLRDKLAHLEGMV